MITAKLRQATCRALLFAAALPCFAGYRVETVPLPPAMWPPEIFAVAFSPEGDLYVASRSGEIWRADRHAQNWRRFASGLNEPLGLLVDSSRVAYVMQRPELTKIEDTDGDGIADKYTTIVSNWGITGNYHEFPYGIKRDKDGNFLGALGLDSGGAKELPNIKQTRGELEKVIVRGEQQWSLVPYRGWSFKVTPAGEFVPWAYGFRQPAGIGVDPDGEFFSIDTQGDWIASSGLIHQKKDHFYGHPASLKWLPGGVPPIQSDEELAQKRTPPAIILPHGLVGVSPGEPVWDTTGGRFGPFSNQIFIGDFSKLISRLYLEKVAGEYQGAAFTFLRDKGLRQGNMRMAFSPDGVLYVGQTSWGVGEGLQRVIWDEKPPVEILAVRLLSRGFALDFTVPMNAAAAARTETFRVNRFRYLYHARYGSPQIDVASVPVTAVRVSNDTRQVELDLADLQPGYVYEFQLETLNAASGEILGNPSAFYTANRLLGGERFTGPFTKPILTPEQSAKGSAVDLAAGKVTYDTFCVACHQADGRGGGTGPMKAAANFVEDTARLAKSDAELLRSIRTGFEATGMPAFGSILSDQQARNVLAYIREAFDPLRAKVRPRSR